MPLGGDAVVERIRRERETGRTLAETEVEGSAHLTGYHQFVLAPDDPIGTGFLIR